MKLSSTVWFFVLWLCFLAKATLGDAIVFSNTAGISIPSRGIATPYPSPIEVTGVSGRILDFSLTISGISHTYSDDLGAVVVSPNGTAVLLFSGPGPTDSENTTPGATRISNQTWVFNDNAAQTLPQLITPTSGTYRPGLNADEYDDNFIAPGPGQAYGFTFSPYLAEDLNGQWKLFVMDGNAGDFGSIAGGWSMTISFDPTAVPEPSTVALFTIISCAGGVTGWRRRRRVISKAQSRSSSLQR